MVPDAEKKGFDRSIPIMAILTAALLFAVGALFEVRSENQKYKEEIAALKTSAKECREGLNVCTREAEKRKLESKRIKDTTWGDVFDSIKRIKCYAKSLLDNCGDNCLKERQ